MTALKDYHVPFYKEFEECIDTYGKCLYIASTGGGKTRCSGEYLTTHDSSALVIVPNEGATTSWLEFLKDRTQVVFYKGFCDNYERYINTPHNVIIFDEAHHSGGEYWSEQITKFIAATEMNKKIIGLTATNITTTGANIGKLFYNNCIVKGPTDEWLVKNKICPDIACIRTAFDYGPYIKSGATTLTSFGSRGVNANDLITMPEILASVRNPAEHKGVIFVSAVNQIAPVIELFSSVIPRNMIKPLHCGLPKRVKEETKRWFMDCRYGYVICIDMLIEGTHPNYLDTVIQLRKTDSYRVFIQQVGRLRSEGVTEPILFDFVGNTADVKQNLEDDDYRISFSKAKSRFIEKLERKPRIYVPKISDQRIIEANTVSFTEAFKGATEILIDDKFAPEDRNFILDHRWQISPPDLSKMLNERYTSDEINSLITAKNQFEAKKYRWYFNSVQLLRKWYPIMGAACYKKIPGTTPYIVKQKAYQLHIIGPEEFALDYIE